MDTGMGKEKKNVEKQGKKEAHRILCTQLYLKQKSYLYKEKAKH